MQPLTRAEVESQPLLLGNKLGIQVNRDPTRLAERLAQHYIMLDFAPKGEFVHRTFTAHANGLMVTCGAVTALQGRTGRVPGRCSVNLVLTGSNLYRADGHDFKIGPQRPLLYGPNHDYSYVTSGYNGVVFDISHDQLLSTAAAMAGTPKASNSIASSLNQFKTLGLDGGRITQLMQRLCKSLKMLENPDCLLSLDIPFLQVDDLIYRHLALILVPPEFLRQPSAGSINQRDRIFEELLEWIRERLDAPLNLTELESRSGYSRRTLQNLFQLRFGCGPIQWIRRHRLEQARMALLNPAPTDTVSSIAGRFGFNSLTVFGRDYNQAFGEKPSESLRLGRRTHL